jgi:hypothetical protein
MPTHDEPNYPDILGYISDNERLTTGVVEYAMTIRPIVVYAGRPF